MTGLRALEVLEGQRVWYVRGGVLPTRGTVRGRSPQSGLIQLTDDTTQASVCVSEVWGDEPSVLDHMEALAQDILAACQERRCVLARLAALDGEG